MENKQTNHIGESNEMVTAVEWLEAKLSTLDDWCFIEQWTIKAKTMEKEQIMEAHEKAYIKMNMSFSAADRAEDYYNETYGNPKP